MSPRSRFFAIALGLAGILSSTSSAFAHGCKHSKCAADLANVSSDVPVIVQYYQDPGDLVAAKLSGLSGLFGGSPRHLHALRALATRVSSNSLEALAQDPMVAHISLDHAVGARGSIATTGEYTAEPINAPLAWAKGYDGSGVGVAVIDSGINVVDDFSKNVKGGNPRNRVVYSQSYVPNELSTTTDAYGHGTHVAGLIGGNGKDSTGNAYYRTFSGIAPGANLLNLRVLDENGMGTDSGVIAAIETAIQLKNQYNIRVINLSLGRPIYESYTVDPLCQAVEQAWQAGIMVVIAAGNDGRDLALNLEGYGTIEAPGNDPYALTVGATNSMNTPSNSDDVMASYSSKGPSFIDQVAKPDIVAPGNLVTSLLAQGNTLQTENPQFYTPLSFYMYGGAPQASSAYFPLSGTSMSTGVVSGAMALLFQAQNNLTPDQAKALVMYSANHSVLPQTSKVTDPSSGMTYTDHNDVFTQGAGYLDIYATIYNAQRYSWLIPVGSALSPIAVYDPLSGDVSLTIASTALWGAGLGNGAGGTALWGAGAIYGQSSFSGAGTALWGAGGNPGGTALWGASDPQGFTALWGAGGNPGGTALWGAATPAAATALWGAGGNPNGSGGTALWGAGGGGSDSTALWGASTGTGSTALWGAGAPYDF